MVSQALPDPETVRLFALTALRRWGVRRDRVSASGERATLLATAWCAGGRNIRELSRMAGVSRQTVYTDLRSQGVDPTDETAPVRIPQYAPLDGDEVRELAEAAQTVLLPSMLCEQPEQLAVAAWHAALALADIGKAITLATSTQERAAVLHAVGVNADTVRRAAQRQRAGEKPLVTPIHADVHDKRPAHEVVETGNEQIMDDDDTTIPSAHELRINDAGTSRAAWVMGADTDEGMGFIAEGVLPIIGDEPYEPDSAVAVWAAELIEVASVAFVPDENRPQVWQVRYGN